MIYQSPLAPSSLTFIRQDPGSVETRAVGLAVSLLGLSAVSSKLEDLRHHVQTLRAGAVPVGSVEFVREAMSVAGLSEPDNISYPKELEALLGRTMSLSTAETARAPGATRFVKPESTKAFTGFVYDPLMPESALDAFGREQHQALWSMEPGDRVWVGPVVEFVAEWRAYMHGGIMMGLERYDPDGPDEVKPPEKSWVEEVARDWLEAAGAPAACAMDLGRLSSGELVLVEVNDAWALGLYGKSIDPKAYLSMLAARWEQLRSVPSLDRHAKVSQKSMKR